jgi:hypothetical protein
VRGLGFQDIAEGFYVVLSEARTNYGSKRKLLWFRIIASLLPLAQLVKEKKVNTQGFHISFYK